MCIEYYINGDQIYLLYNLLCCIECVSTRLTTDCFMETSARMRKELFFPENELEEGFNT